MSAMVISWGSGGASVWGTNILHSWRHAVYLVDPINYTCHRATDAVISASNSPDSARQF